MKLKTAHRRTHSNKPSGKQQHSSKTVAPSQKSAASRNINDIGRTQFSAKHDRRQNAHRFRPFRGQNREVHRPAICLKPRFEAKAKDIIPYPIVPKLLLRVSERTVKVVPVVITTAEPIQDVIRQIMNRSQTIGFLFGGCAKTTNSWTLYVLSYSLEEVKKACNQVADLESKHIVTLHGLVDEKVIFISVDELTAVKSRGLQALSQAILDQLAV